MCTKLICYIGHTYVYKTNMLYWTYMCIQAAYAYMQESFTNIYFRNYVNNALQRTLLIF